MLPRLRNHPAESARDARKQRRDFAQRRVGDSKVNVAADAEDRPGDPAPIELGEERRDNWHVGQRWFATLEISFHRGARGCQNMFHW